jgi:DNA-binding response OmpR family regulator
MPRILIVEDNQHMQRIYCEKLSREGFEVITASTGEDGLAQARARRPDLILLDIMLPKLSGFDVLKQIRADADLAAVPVFMLSNKAWPDDVTQALSLGAQRFFPKGSTSLHEIVMEVRQDCGLKRLIVTSGNKDAAAALAGLLTHPRLLCSQAIVLAETMSAIERAKPDIVVLDGRPHSPNAFAMLQQLKTTPSLQAITVVAVADDPRSLQRADAGISVADLDTRLRPLVLKLLGLEENTPAAAVCPAA